MSRQGRRRFIASFARWCLGPFGVPDPDHGVWDRGVLHVGKYQSFQAEAPFATFDPAHVSKWGPHELLHRAVGFFHRKDMSRFELYLGARLNELLPVALWYGHDQLARLDEDGFDRRRAALHAEPADALWWTETPDALRVRTRRTIRWLRAGVDHVREELAIIDREIETGRRLASPRLLPDARLDAASDATAYVVGHWARLQSAATASVLGRVPHAKTIGELRAAVEETHERSCFGDLELDLDELETRRRERMTWDWLLRAALVDPDATERLLKSDRPFRDHESWRNEIESTFGDDAAIVLSDGLEGIALQQLHEGVVSVAPCTASCVTADALVVFATRSPSRGPLAERLSAFFEDTGPDWMRELVRLEQLVAEPSPETAVPFLCDPDGDHVVRNDAFRLFEAEHDVVAVHAGEADEAPATPGSWLVGSSGGEMIVLDVNSQIRALWIHLADQALPIADVLGVVGEEGMSQLISLGVLGRIGSVAVSG